MAYTRIRPGPAIIAEARRVVSFKAEIDAAVTELEDIIGLYDEILLTIEECAQG